MAAPAGRGAALGGAAARLALVAGRLHTGGTQDAFRQQWSYDVTFSTPIALDPAAKTVPRK